MSADLLTLAALFVFSVWAILADARSATRAACERINEGEA